MTIAAAEPFLRSTRASDRATAAEYLANVCVGPDSPSDERSAAECALTLLADDPSPKVRAAIAAVLAGNRRAPVHLVLHLAKDQPQVAAPILLRSPLLDEGDLIELAATVAEPSQCVIARRPGLLAGVVAALCELGSRDAVIELARNDDAEILPWSYRRMVARFGEDAELREILIRDRRLPVDCRHQLLARLGEVLSRSPLVAAVIGTERAAKVTREACARSSLSLAEQIRPAEFTSLIGRLRQSGELTTALVLRCLANGKMDFFVHLLADLANCQHERVQSVVSCGRDLALVAVFEKAGLAVATHAALVCGVHHWRAALRDEMTPGPHGASRAMLDAATADAGGMSSPVVGLLRQIHAETVRSGFVGRPAIAA